MGKIEPRPGGGLYDRDFLAWTERQARLLREGRLAELDAANLDLDDNPGLKDRLPEIFRKAYGEGRREASRETGIALKIFPAESPYTLEQVRQDGWRPAS